ncbi:hypothetical protein HZC20_01935 [Candidatus Peregrinibacteria bacterium]|nr:hypothetical protein [Candidatus Peregrinibacteria bacterium]
MGKIAKEPLKNDGLQGNEELTNEPRSEANNLAPPVVRRSELTNKELVRRGGGDLSEPDGRGGMVLFASFRKT